MGLSALLLLALVLYAGLGGAALLARLFADEADPAIRQDVVASFALPVGLIAAALPGWMLSAFIHVNVAYVAVPLAAATIAGLLLLFWKDLRTISLDRRLALPLAITFGIFLFFVFLRFYSGEIRQTEKPMDFAVLTALMSQPSLPITDPWLAGGAPPAFTERFPYYHFGTYLFALPMRAAGLAPEVGYNLVAALLGGLTAGAAFGAVRARRGGRALGLVAALAVVLAGTPDGARQVLAGLKWPVDPWPSSRRVLNAITEWPLFTVWLGDLHPHAMALPLLVAWAGLAGRCSGLLGVAFDAALLASLLSANPWDLPAALLLLGVGCMMERRFRDALVRSVLTVFVSAPFLLAFLLSPRPSFGGIGVFPGGTTSVEAFLHFGAMLLVPALAVGVALIRAADTPEKALFLATLFPAAGIALGVLSKQPVMGLALAFIFAVLTLLPKLEGALKAGFLWAMAGAILVLVPEVVFVKDAYGEALRRMNTVFKTYAGAWPLLAMGSALLLAQALSTRRLRFPIRGLVLLAAMASLCHPLSFIYNRLRAPGDVVRNIAANIPDKREGTLDGLVWLTKEYPGDRKAIDWLRRNARPLDVVAEAPGGGYEDRGRIGTGSGRPTVLGWYNHESVWRGTGIHAVLDQRKQDLRTVYTSSDPQEVQRLLSTWRARYVVVGPLEKKDYGETAFPARAAFKQVFSEDGTELYEVGS